MRTPWRIAPLLALLGLLSLAGCRSLSEHEQQVVDTILANEHEERWKEIDWEPTLNEALVRAQQEEKPILFFFSVNEDGREGAESC